MKELGSWGSAFKVYGAAVGSSLRTQGLGSEGSALTLRYLDVEDEGRPLFRCLRVPRYPLPSTHT